MFVSLAPAFSGLDEFTKIRVYERWLIERKINGLTNQVLCRASIADSGLWFAARIRINDQGVLLIPPELDNEEGPELKEVNKVRSFLEECKTSVIYLPRVF